MRSRPANLCVLKVDDALQSSIPEISHRLVEHRQIESIVRFDSLPALARPTMEHFCKMLMCLSRVEYCCNWISKGKMLAISDML